MKPETLIAFSEEVQKIAAEKSRARFRDFAHGVAAGAAGSGVGYGVGRFLANPLANALLKSGLVKNNPATAIRVATGLAGGLATVAGLARLSLGKKVLERATNAPK